MSMSMKRKMSESEGNNVDATASASASASARASDEHHLHNDNDNATDGNTSRSYSPIESEAVTLVDEDDVDTEDLNEHVDNDILHTDEDNEKNKTNSLSLQHLPTDTSYYTEDRIRDLLTSFISQSVQQQ